MVQRRMKPLLILLLGALCGSLATVLFFTIDPAFETDERDGAGGGNARISLDEDALASLITQQLPQVPGFDPDTRVQVTIDASGVIRVDLAVGKLGVGVQSSIVINPNVVDGRLHLSVVEAKLAPLVAPDQLAHAIEAPLQKRLDALANGFAYRLTSIATTDRRLTLEIKL
jgi:hypothetical protein